MVPVQGNMVTVLAVDFGDAASPGGAKTWTAVNTSSEQTVTIPGVRLATDKAFGITKPTFQTGLSVDTVRVSADDTIAITFNTTGSSVTPTAGEKYTVLLGRLENPTTYNAVA